MLQNYFNDLLADDNTSGILHKHVADQRLNKCNEII